MAPKILEATWSRASAARSTLNSQNREKVSTPNSMRISQLLSSRYCSISLSYQQQSNSKSKRVDFGRASSEPQLWHKPRVFTPSKEHLEESRMQVKDSIIADGRGTQLKEQVETVVESSSGSSWAVPPLQHDVGVTLLVLVGAYAWVRLFDLLTEKKILGQKLSRKLVHITSGLLYAFCWPLYSILPWARFLAVLVPVSNGIRLLVYGLGILKDEGLVKSVSREGDPRELLRGPLYYVVVLVFSTVLFWRDSPVGVMALAMMCGGDGIADIVGRKFGSTKLPYNPDKSWAGSIAMFLFGFLVSFGCFCYFSALGYYSFDVQEPIVRIAAVSFMATLVESLPITTKLDDNLTVPLTAVVLGMFLFPSVTPVLCLP